MGPIAELPSWSVFLDHLVLVLMGWAQWLLTSGFGKPLLIISLVLIVLSTVTVLHGGVNDDTALRFAAIEAQRVRTRKILHRKLIGYTIAGVITTAVAQQLYLNGSFTSIGNAILGAG